MAAILPSACGTDERGLGTDPLRDISTQVLCQKSNDEQEGEDAVSKRVLERHVYENGISPAVAILCVILSVRHCAEGSA